MNDAPSPQPTAPPLNPIGALIGRQPGGDYYYVLWANATLWIAR